MARSTGPAEKLISSVVKTTTRTTRRQQYSASTKKALVSEARERFTEHGYSNTSLDAIVAGARVTKGALYHHFSGKRALFEAVFDQVEDDASRTINRALRGETDPWAKAAAGLRAFLSVVQDPTYQRIVIQEGPAILGYERFRHQEERSSFGLVQDIVGSVLSSSTYDLEEEMLLTFSRIFFGALSAAGEYVTSAQSSQRASVQVEVALGFILEGLRALAESGAELPDPELLLAQREGLEEEHDDEDLLDEDDDLGDEAEEPEEAR